MIPFISIAALDRIVGFAYAASGALLQSEPATLAVLGLLFAVAGRMAAKTFLNPESATPAYSAEDRAAANTALSHAARP